MCLPGLSPDQKACSGYAAPLSLNDWDKDIIHWVADSLMDAIRPLVAGLFWGEEVVRPSVASRCHPTHVADPVEYLLEQVALRKDPVREAVAR